MNKKNFFKRSLPPVASPIYLSDLLRAIFSIFSKDRYKLRKSFKNKIKEYFNVKDCFLFSSGRAGLTVVLQALKRINKRRNEVVIPAFTCYSVAASIVKAGLNIVPCDINKDTLDFDYDMLLRIMEERKDKILAIIPVHLFGLHADVKFIKEIAYPDIYVIEDAAQCLGLKNNKGLIGKMGDVGLFSLGRGKSITSVGGGIIITDNEEIAFHIRNIMKRKPTPTFLKEIYYFLYGLMLSIFINPDLYWLPGSLPFLKIGETIYDPDFKIEKISVCQIAFAFNWDKKVKILRRIRILLSKIWFSFFKDKKEFSCLISKNGPFELIRFPLIVKDKRIRENILKKSKAKGLGIEKSYPDSIDNIGEISHMFKERNFPSAKYVATHIITLPTHNFVSINDIKLITDLM